MSAARRAPLTAPQPWRSSSLDDQSADHLETDPSVHRLSDRFINWINITYTKWYKLKIQAIICRRFHKTEETKIDQKFDSNHIATKVGLKESKAT